jgi:Dna[CI] antecedent, DciA
LPPSEAVHITGIVHCDSEIVMLVDSSVWCARLRYRAGALRSRLAALVGQEIRELRVRVAPR